MQAEIDAQYRALAALRAASADDYRAIGPSCVGNERWRAAYEAITPGLPAYQRDAIEEYTATWLGWAGTGPRSRHPSRTVPVVQRPSPS
ncbi:hypothetical protein YW7DRAFT_03271 [Streptomyces sp. AmelKG-E11A]|nr:hypothetical protein YW7DRAFT_03271 [Streptomyces sp. AmelKG-E11A]